MGIKSIGPNFPYSEAERHSARLSLIRSRFFLVLGLGSQLGCEDNPVPATICSCHKPEAVLRVISLIGDKTFTAPHESARILIELKEKQSPKSCITTANRIVSAMEGLFSQVQHLRRDFEPYQFPKELMKGAEIDVGLLKQLEILTGRSSIIDFTGKLSYVIIGDDQMAAIFYLLPFVLQNEHLFDACNFFRSCCSEYSLMDGVVWEVLREPKQEPETETQRLSVENVVLQAFRTIEALVGEPGDERKFRTRLKAYGMDYDEPVGFGLRRRHRLGERIRWLQQARDSAAAHGKRRRTRPFTMYEVMEAQHLADSVLHNALWFTAASTGRTGDDGEIAFLLAEMFPGPSSPQWVNDTRLFRGRSAVDLVREPAGLKVVTKYLQRNLKEEYSDWRDLVKANRKHQRSVKS
jgi:hypothetical protein